MRARIRPSFLLFCLLLLVAFLPVQAQINGVAPSVTSFGFGGSNNPTPGVPASVTSLGPNGFGNGGDCCFVPFSSNRPPFFGDRRSHDHHRFPVGISMPVYVPYAVPYPVAYAQDDTGDDESADIDYTFERGVPKVYEHGPWYREASAHPARRDPPPKAKAKTTGPPTPPETPEAVEPVETPEPVPDQPTTVLIFKDGHKSTVQNYAIVGSTLFDFTDGRSRKIPLADLDLPATQKANDERGVDFQIPAKTTQVSQKK
jgi:hypothetical protein